MQANTKCAQLRCRHPRNKSEKQMPSQATQNTQEFASNIEVMILILSDTTSKETEGNQKDNIRGEHLNCDLMHKSSYQATIRFGQSE